MFYGVGGILLLILDIFAILQVMQSSMSGGNKLLWIVLILLLPLVGPILWFTVGGGSLDA